MIEQIWRAAGRLLPLIAGFALVHVALVALALHGPGYPLGDVDIVYLHWAQGIASNTVLVGITADFVYPILAAVPIVAALAFGPENYTATWLALVALCNVAVFALLLRRIVRATGTGRYGEAADGAMTARRWYRVAWWWLVFLLLLGPVALGRIDGVTAPLVILALLGAAERPVLAAALLTAATWIKVWPAAVIAALLVASAQRARVFVVAAATSLVIMLAAIVGSIARGSGAHVLSFITEQSGRGVQVESPLAGFWMWRAALGDPAVAVYYDTEILTYQVSGPGTQLASDVMTPLLGLVAVAVLLLGVLAHRRGAPMAALLPTLSLALVLVLILVNKVGSPQFITWVAAPIMLGLVRAPRRWCLPASLALVLAGLTQLIYPVFYNAVLAAEPGMLIVLTARNLLEVALLAWALGQIVLLVRSGHPAGAAGDPSRRDDHPPARNDPEYNYP